uniref:Integrase catalytic domain-containing protein n=1 Tax=viral metagenome TaxID=1070528 RepID=A0A6C0EIP7_9ZZZZ
MNNYEILKKFYYDPKFGLSNKEIFKQKIQKLYPNITNKEINDFYYNLEVNQLVKKPIIKKSNFYKIVDVPLTFQTDIMIFNKSQKIKNRGIYMYLTLIDVLSRKAFMYPIKTRKTEDIIEAYNKFLVEMKTLNKQPVKLISDDEFNNKAFLDLNKKLNILVDYQTAKDDHITSGNRLGIIDRFTKTFKNKVIKYQLSTGNINFIYIYKDLLDNYNNTQHSGINNNTPNEAFNNPDIQIEYRKEALEHNHNIYNNINLKIGDTIRAIKTNKTIFDKEGINFSKKIYTIDDIKGLKYIIKDEDGNIKKKLYKAHELQIVDKNKIDKLEKPNINKEIKKLKKDEKIKTNLKQDDIKEENILLKPRERKIINYKLIKKK